MQAQMWSGRDTLYGNEWIDYGKTYYKIPVAQDGMYQLSYEALVQSGLPLDNLTGAQFQLFHLGEEAPLYVSTDGSLSPGDYLLFYGEQNRGELDRHLFQNPEEEMLNPQYSMFTDTAVYYLTWAAAGTPVRRYQDREMDVSDPPAAEGYFMGRARVIFNSQYSKTYTRASGVTLERSNFTAVEGFGNGSSEDLSRELTFPNVHRKAFDIELPGLASSAATGELRIRFGCGPGDHRQELTIDGETYGVFQFAGFQVQDTTVTIPATSLRNKLSIQLEGKIIDEQTQKTYDGQTVAFAEVSYPRNFDFQGQPVFFFDLPASNARRYLEITNFDVQTNEKPVLFDLTTNLRYETIYENGLVKILLPPATQVSRLCLLNEQRGVLPITSLEAVNFINYDDLEGNYIILSHPTFFDDGAGGNPVQEYADYRASSHEGEHRPVIVDVTQLYEQFAYGLQRHPLAIRNFAHYIKRNWPAPQYFFIIGKGREFPFMRSATQFAEAHGQTFFVPTFGYPGSDNLLLSDNGSSAPVFAVGRVAATSSEDIRIYLEKIKAFEANRDNPQTIPTRAWMKRIMHLGGGGVAVERAQIQYNLRRMEEIIEGNKFGGEVTSYFKSSTDVLDQSVSDRIFNTINGGLSMLTFFGHSSPDNFDFSIDAPDKYDNAGRCPLMLSLGCYSGNVFTSQRSIGERFTFFPDKAAVAFGASRGLGFVSSLSDFAGRFYQNIGSVYYSRGIGDALQATIAQMDDSSLSNKLLVQQFNLHGDPAVRLHPSPGPDYVIDAQSVRFVPEIIPAHVDSFTISFDLLNLGQFRPDSLSLRLQQELPSGKKIELGELRVHAPAFSDNISVNLPGRGTESTGLNYIYITVDPDNEVTESPPQAEMNNELTRASGEAGIPLFIIDNTARPIFPPNFGIIGESSLALKASTTNALAPNQNYILELDTTVRFDSPFKRQVERTQQGGVIQWETNIDLTPNQVYYWRISPDSTTTGIGYAWESSSLTYIPNSGDGWSQGHYWQWLEGEEKGIKFDSTTRSFALGSEVINIRIRNKLYDPENRPGLIYNSGGTAVSVQPWNYLDEGLAVVVSDPVTASFWQNRSGVDQFEPGEYGVLTGGNRVFAFPTQTPEQRANFIDFVENVIPDGYHVFIFTIAKTEAADLNVDEWAIDSIDTGKNIFSVLENEGAQMVRQLDSGKKAGLYIFMYQKGTGKLDEGLEPDVNAEIYVDANIPRALTEGSYYSPIIGPAQHWASVQWNREDPASPPNGTFVRLFGLRGSTERELLLDSIQSLNTSIDFISPSDFPYLQLELWTRNRLDRALSSTGSWRVFYDGLPDAALNPSSFFQPNRDTLAQGENLYFETMVENISAYDMDSLLVHFTLTDAQNNERRIVQRLAPLPAGQQLRLTLPVDTREMTGQQSLFVRINPDNDQPELHTFNNTMQWRFLVEPDQRNPILDVTFDGNRILDGDLVSTSPLISILLEDENQYLALNDSSLFNVAIIYPDGRRADFRDVAENVVFTNDTKNGKNRAILEFSSTFEQDGTHQLIVEARDKSGNKAGATDYRISFEIITRKSISNLVNYPNPFSTATQFVYTITGAIPSFLKIQIMTVSGRVVKEIDQMELGALQVGTHRSEYIWDGTDDFGNQLANGVYLYRVIAKDEQGQDYEHYDNGTDSFFKKGFGKLVILR